MSLSRDLALGDAPIHPQTLFNVQGHVDQDPVQDEGRPEMRTVEAVVGGIRLLSQPLSLVGSVVEDNVTDAQDAPLVLQLPDHGLNLLPGGLEGQVQAMLIPQGVARIGAAQGLELNENIDRLIGSWTTYSTWTGVK